MKKKWHEIQHLLSGFLHKDLVISSYVQDERGLFIYFECDKCDKRPRYNFRVKNQPK